MLRLAGDVESAGPPWREALALYEQKGDITSAERIRARLASLTVVSAQR